jgi:hypothetical protein
MATSVAGASALESVSTRTSHPPGTGSNRQEPNAGNQANPESRCSGRAIREICTPVLAAATQPSGSVTIVG